MGSRSAWIIGKSVTLLWPVVSVATAVILTGTVWLLLERWDPELTGRVGIGSSLVLFGQSLDAITTMIGIDVLGFSEQVRLSRLIIDSTAALPIASVLGTTWVFVLLKPGVAVGIVVWTGRSIDLGTVERHVILGVAAATGVIPAVNNLALQSL